MRLGEIGYSAPYDASSMWIEAPRQQRKTKPGVKAPRIRPLEHLAAETTTAVMEEEWGVIEPTTAGKEQKRRTTNSKPRGKGRLGWTSKEPEMAPPEEEEKDYEDEDEEDEKPESPLEEAPISAATSSDSEEDLHAASDGSEEANPNSHEMQGAIEDGPNGKQRQVGERRSGRQAASRVNKNTNRDIDIIAMKDSIAIRDSEIAGEPLANGTTMIVTPNSSSQRGMLSAGVSGWLQDLGLGKYAELFELNEVDTEVLPLLTFDDLREMGVEAVGARRKMFHGIQELGQIRGI